MRVVANFESVNNLTDLCHIEHHIFYVMMDHLLKCDTIYIGDAKLFLAN